MPYMRDNTASSLKLYSFLGESRYAILLLLKAKPITDFTKQDSEVIASKDNSVLMVTFPKTTPEMVPKKVQIGEGPYLYGLCYNLDICSC